jgi:hypothetical protein
VKTRCHDIQNISRRSHLGRRLRAMESRTPLRKLTDSGAE